MFPVTEPIRSALEQRGLIYPEATVILCGSPVLYRWQSCYWWAQ